MKRFYKVVVGTCAHSFQQIVFPILASKQHYVCVVTMRLGLANFAAEFDSVNLWKNPVQQGQSWRIPRLKQFPRGCAILGDLKIKAPFLQVTADEVSIYRGVFREQNCHWRLPLG